MTDAQVVIYITDVCEECKRDVGEADLMACGERTVCEGCWTFEIGPVHAAAIEAPCADDVNPKGT